MKGIRPVGLGVLVTLVTALLGAPASQASTGLTYTPVPGWWGTNGRVTDSALVGNRVYLAGGFDYIGPQTGYGVAVSSSTGTKLATTPLITGTVNTVVADGAGGWYIGGNFSKVGAVSRRDAVHIDASGNVTRWNPKPNGPVNAIVDLGGSIVLGGSFTMLGTTATSASNIGAVDPSVGTRISGFSASTNGSVQALLAGAGKLYVGGSFTAVNGMSGTGLNRIDATTGAADPTWGAHANGTVNALALSGDGRTLYAGGEFSAVVGAGQWVNRTRLGAFATNGGAVTSWAPSSSGTVRALAVDSSSQNIYLGGQFDSVNGTARTALAQVDRSGLLTSFNASLSGCHIPNGRGNRHVNPTCSPEVDSLAVSNATLYVGGRFGASGALARHDAAAFPLGNSTPTSWNPVASDQVLTVAANSSAVFLGGNLTSVNGLLRSGLAALNASTGQGDSTFQANTDNMPLDLELSSDASRLYVAGNFTTIAGQSHAYLASINTGTGTVDPSFVSNVDGLTFVAKYSHGYLYVGGDFASVNSVPRLNMVKVSATTGAVDSRFVANTTGPTGADYRNGMIEGLAVSPDGARVYLAGPFSTINGDSSITQGIAVMSSTDATLVPNQLGGVQACSGIGRFITYLTLSTDGTRLYGGDECPDAVYQWNATTLSTPSNPTGLNWRTACDGGMQAAVEVNAHLYYGTHGKVCNVSPSNPTRVLRTRYAVFDASNGTLLPDNPSFDSPMGVFSLTALPQGMLVGGDFTYAGASKNIHQGLALFPGTP